MTQATMLDNANNYRENILSSQRTMHILLVAEQRNWDTEVKRVCMIEAKYMACNSCVTLVCFRFIFLTPTIQSRR